MNLGRKVPNIDFSVRPCELFLSICEVVILSFSFTSGLVSLGFIPVVIIYHICIDFVTDN